MLTFACDGQENNTTGPLDVRSDQVLDDFLVLARSDHACTRVSDSSFKQITPESELLTGQVAEREVRDVTAADLQRDTVARESYFPCVGILIWTFEKLV